MQKLLLFDIDGTLLSRSRGHAEAFAVAFSKVHGLYASIYMVKYQGRTDKQLIREVLLQAGVPNHDIDNKMPEFLKVMYDYFDAIQQHVRSEAVAGVPETIKLLANKGYLLGLATGNLERFAHAKLASVGIDTYFRLGGFGSDAEKRPDLVRKAMLIAQKRFGFNDPNETYLFGDAPEDMEAAASNGIKAIGVTTGVYRDSELRDAGATKVISGVGAQSEVIAVLQTGDLRQLR